MKMSHDHATFTINTISSAQEVAGASFVSKASETDLHVSEVVVPSELPLVGQRLTADDVYFSQEYGSPGVAAVMRLVREAIAECERAIKSLQREDPLDADDHVSHCQAALVEAFGRRVALPDGFGILVVGTIWAIQNLSGSIATPSQLKAIAATLQTLVAGPFMSSDEAAQETLRLEEAGLNPTIPRIGDLMAGLYDE